MGVNGGIGFGLAATSRLRWDGELVANAPPEAKNRQALAVTPETTRRLLMPDRFLKQRLHGSACTFCPIRTGRPDCAPLFPM